MDIHDIVLEIVCEQLDLDSDSISLDDKLMDDLYADSLDLVEIELKLEDKFELDNGYDAEAWFENNVTFGQLVDYVQYRVKYLAK